MNLQFPMTTTEIPENPKITLNLRGLGVLCFSEENNRAEIGYLDVPFTHDATFELLDTDNNTVIPQTSMRGSTLNIVSAEKGMGKVYNQPKDKRSFNVMLDLSEIYGEGSELKADAPFQSKVFIDNAVFFTDPGNINTVVPFDLDRPHIKGRPMEIGEWLVAHTTSDDVEFHINDEKYPLDGGKNYILRIISGCRHILEPQPESDFKFFFDILDNAGAVKFNLQRAEAARIALTDLEKREVFELHEQFRDTFIENDGNGDSMERAKTEIFSKLQFFSAMFCAPQPCVKVTFANRPRSL